jgi:uncharacterized protein YbjT (DUF2867 family)
MEAFLVLGATGTQGGATVRGLLVSSTSCKIHALTRDVSSIKAQQLHSLSPRVRLFEGTHDDLAALSAAAAGVTGAFINVSMEKTDYEAEQRYVRKTLEALSEISSMKRVVYTSVIGARDPSVPGNFKGVEPDTFRYAYYANKAANEKLVQRTAEQCGWSWTIIQPAVFMTNLLPPLVNMMYPQLRERRVETAFPEDHKRFWTDPRDTGRFAAHALLGQDNLRNQTIPLANEYVTDGQIFTQLESAIKEKTGQEVQIQITRIPPGKAQEMRHTNLRVESELNQMENESHVDLTKLEEYGIVLGTMRDFFERESQILGSVLGL